MGIRSEIYPREAGIHAQNPGYKRQSLVMGIRFEIYPREAGIHAFRALSSVQEHGDKRDPRDKLLLANLEKNLGPECVNSW
jgi:hypothetical protein